MSSAYSLICSVLLGILAYFYKKWKATVMHDKHRLQRILWTLNINHMLSSNEDSTFSLNKIFEHLQLCPPYIMNYELPLFTSDTKRQILRYNALIIKNQCKQKVTAADLDEISQLSNLLIKQLENQMKLYNDILGRTRISGVLTYVFLPLIIGKITREFISLDKS
jgi:hypothetical protein